MCSAVPTAPLPATNARSSHGHPHARALALVGASNFRDLGGLHTADGRRIREGKLLRSGALHQMTDEDLSHLDNLPVTRVIDYRDPLSCERCDAHSS